MPAYLLYGEDIFSSRKKLEEIKSRFFDSNMGNINITILEGEEVNLEALKKAICLVPFLAKKRLIIIKNFLLKGKKEVKDQAVRFLDEIPDFAISVFYEEGDLDKSSALFRKLKADKKVENFPLLSQYSMTEWCEREIRKKCGKIERDALNKLVAIIGPDLWRASLEIDKLTSYRKYKLITKEDVSLLVKEEIHPNIFALIDALGARDIKKAYRLLDELLSSGENESYILSMIAYQFRNLLIIKDLLESQKSLSASGLRPFVLGKAKVQAQNFTKDQLKNIYGKLLETDLHIKNGSLKPYLALDLLISEFV